MVKFNCVVLFVIIIATSYIIYFRYKETCFIQKRKRDKNAIIHFDLPFVDWVQLIDTNLNDPYDICSNVNWKKEIYILNQLINDHCKKRMYLNSIYYIEEEEIDNLRKNLSPQKVLILINFEKVTYITHENDAKLLTYIKPLEDCKKTTNILYCFSRFPHFMAEQEQEQEQ